MIEIALSGFLWFTPLQVTCEHRSAVHVAEHGGLAADSAWHVAHGDLPTCDTSASEPYTHERLDSSSDEKGKGKKSRFCRRHWFC